MSDNSPIEWTNATWNPLRAVLQRELTIKGRVFPKGTLGWFCSKISPGCAHCYAEKINLRLGNGLTYASVNLDEIEWKLVNLDRPSRWRLPRKVFVNSMTDLFHDAVPRELIDQVFVAMALAPQHTFQVLTKRAIGMQMHLSAPDRVERIYEQWPAVSGSPAALPEWPLKNVWLGVSVENQECANGRIPSLLETPAAVRFLSCEPLLGEIDFDEVPMTDRCYGVLGNAPGMPIGIDWVIAGGESGRKGRPGERRPAPLHPDWVRSLRDQCQAAKVPFFFKQWGNWLPHPHPPIRGKYTGAGIFLHRNGAWGCNGDFWDGKAVAMDNVGKKVAGRVLDGREWNEMPALQAVRE